VSPAVRRAVNDAAGRIAVLDMTAREQMMFAIRALDDTDADTAEAAARTAAETVATLAAARRDAVAAALAAVAPMRSPS